MSKLNNPREWVEFSPASEAVRPEAERIAYFLRVPTVYDRPKLKKALASRGAQPGAPLDRLRAARAAVDRVYSREPGHEEAAAALRGALATVETALWTAYAAADRWRKAQRTGASDDECKALRGDYLEANAAMLQADAEIIPMLSTLAEIDPAFAEARGAWAVYDDLHGIEAARMFVMDWRGLPRACERDHTGLTGAALRAIPEFHFQAIGRRVEELMQPTAEQAANFASPSDTSTAGTISTAESTQPASVH